MNTIQIKIQKTSRILFSFLIILSIIVFVDIIVQILAMIWINTTPENIVNFRIGNIPVFYPFANTLDVSEYELTAFIVAEVIKQSIIISILFIAGAIFRDISREHTPFSAKHVNRVKLISKLLLAVIFIPPVIQTLLTLNSSETVKMGITLGLSNVIFAVIFYCLSRIFDYGRILQDQSDETL